MARWMGAWVGGWIGASHLFQQYFSRVIMKCRIGTRSWAPKSSKIDKLSVLPAITKWLLDLLDF